jgi:hypothetical protein
VLTEFYALYGRDADGQPTRERTEELRMVDVRGEKGDMDA